jgi:iron complex outermembrane receptor protein
MPGRKSHSNPQPQTAVSLFTNGVNTKTRGAELMGDYIADYGWSKVDWSIGATYNDTTASNIRSGPATLAGQKLFDLTAISNLTTASPRYVVNLGSAWAIQKLTVNLRESLYGPSSQWVNDSGATAPAASAAPAVTYYLNKIAFTPITNVDLAYAVLKNCTISVGSLNAFNRYPNKVNSALTAAYNNPKVQSNSAVSQYPSFTPFGFNGGFYYVRAMYSF